MDRLRAVAENLLQYLREARENAVVRWVGYAVIVGLGFIAALNLVVGFIAGLMGDLVVAGGLILLGVGFVLACELLFDFLVRQDGSNSLSS